MAVSSVYMNPKMYDVRLRLKLDLPVYQLVDSEHSPKLQASSQILL